MRDRNNSFTVHHRNIRNLAAETFRFSQGLSSPILNGVLVEQVCNYNLRSNNCLNRQKVNLGRYGTESSSLLAPKIWDI